MSAKTKPLKDEGSRLEVVAAGATAGLVSRFVIAPLDVIKIRLQLQTHSLSDPLTTRNPHGGRPTYPGTLRTLRTILQQEGLTALWKGNVPAELLYVLYNAIHFTTYRQSTLLLQHLTPASHPLPRAAESFLAGAAAGATATAATYPLDLLRTRFAAQGNERVYPSLRHAVTQIARDEGPAGFYRGLTPALAQIVPYMGVFFAAYETLRVLPFAELVQLPYGAGDAVAGTLASVVAKTGAFPLDLVRKRIQVQGPTRERYVYKNIPEYPGTMAGTVRVIVRREGWRGLYRGLTVSLLKAAPASAVTMWTYERALKFYGGLGGSRERGGHEP